MAFNITDTTYAGESASTFIVKAMTGNETVQGGNVYIKDGIKKQFTIPRFDAEYEDFIQDRQAEPSTSAGDMVISGRLLDPQDYMIFSKFNPRDYEDHWFATQLNPTLIDRSLPATVESVVTQEVLKRHDRYTNKAFWNSQTSNASTSKYKYYNGFIKKAQLETSGTDATNIVSSPTTLSAGNIQAELGKVYAKIPSALKYDPNFKIFVNYKTYDFYMDSQINQTYKGVDVTNNGVGRYKGLEVVKIADFPDDVIFGAKSTAGMDSNLWVGMNSTQDASIQLGKLTNYGEMYFLKMLMKVDVQIGWCSEVVLYGSI
jgi:hypothetical protein